MKREKFPILPPAKYDAPLRVTRHGYYCTDGDRGWVEFDSSIKRVLVPKLAITKRGAMNCVDMTDEPQEERTSGKEIT